MVVKRGQCTFCYYHGDIAVRKPDNFFKQIGGWVVLVGIGNLPVTALVHGEVERQRQAGAALAEPGLGSASASAGVWQSVGW